MLADLVVPKTRLIVFVIVLVRTVVVVLQLFAHFAGAFPGQLAFSTLLVLGLHLAEIKVVIGLPGEILSLVVLLTLVAADVGVGILIFVVFLRLVIDKSVDVESAAARHLACLLGPLLGALFGLLGFRLVTVVTVEVGFLLGLGYLLLDGFLQSEV